MAPAAEGEDGGGGVQGGGPLGKQAAEGKIIKFFGNN